jgi:hypothetical protein
VPGGTTLTHIKTVIFGYGYNGVSTSVPLSFQSKYVTWAYTGSAYGAAYHAAGIKALTYTNYWRNYTIEKPVVDYTDIAPGGADASAESKTCSGAPVYDPKYGGGYLNDPRTARAVDHALLVIGQHKAYRDALASDDTGVTGGVNGTPCNYNYNTWIAATNAVNAKIGLPMFINALNGWAIGGNSVTQVQLTQPANILGAQCEMCYANNGGAIGGKNWTLQETAEVGMVRAHKIFWDYARNTTSAPYAQSLRTYVLASFLLTYDPNYAMLEEAFATPTDFEVMPETQLVPLQPLTTASDVAGYVSSGGAYWRQFGACYYKGAFVGKCAVAVNPGSTSVSLPANSFSHSLTVSGSDIYDGGSASTAGPKVSALGPLTGAVLFP